jgi:hypothetical protein
MWIFKKCPAGFSDLQIVPQDDAAYSWVGSRSLVPGAQRQFIGMSRRSEWARQRCATTGIFGRRFCRRCRLACYLLDLKKPGWKYRPGLVRRRRDVTAEIVMIDSVLFPDKMS